MFSKAELFFSGVKVAGDSLFQIIYFFKSWQRKELIIFQNAKEACFSTKVGRAGIYERAFFSVFGAKFFFAKNIPPEMNPKMRRKLLIRVERCDL